MLGLMLLLAGVGLALLFTAPALARLAVGHAGDPVGLRRILQVVAVGLLLAALLVRPHSDKTAVFPPPPDAVDSAGR